MDFERNDDAPSEPMERDYREGMIIVIILILVIIFELYLKAFLLVSIQDKAEVCIIFFAIGLIHLLSSHLLAFIYNCKHLIMLRLLGICRGRARPRHAKAVGVVFLLAGIMRWFM